MEPLSTRSFSAAMKRRVCADLEHSGLNFCKHIVAATLRKSKTFRCEGCGERFPNGELYEAPEDHLTFFQGGALCGDCALHHGVL